MRLLIPTNDGINLSPDFDRATAFRFLTVINGSIKEDQLMKSPDKSEKGLHLIQDRMFKKNSAHRINNTDLELQQIVITRKISKDSLSSLQVNNYKVFHSGETIIINAVNNYLKDYSTFESDYCCSP
jgi:predicted Fe-Mo cluster-binding NifX family protein